MSDPRAIIGRPLTVSGKPGNVLVDRLGERSRLVRLLFVAVIKHAVIKPMLDRQRIDDVENVAVFEMRIGQSEKRSPDDFLAGGLRTTNLDEIIKRLTRQSFHGAVHESLVDPLLFFHFVSSPQISGGMISHIIVINNRRFEALIASRPHLRRRSLRRHDFFAVPGIKSGAFAYTHSWNAKTAPSTSSDSSPR
ncbi:hypothetical conserved protein (plasmid) [Rhizobium etli CIAT 652]|uniref:Hypothetical conserved protein n=1 Tax=Rhizobium etli (strain CIAT 652) TaxID=491916 RepID=B3Q0Z5_RHIE6|nr:hypothetical conserved protein [Rhizobium etli CIAT 652]